jgi:hypothetical protein
MQRLLKPGYNGLETILVRLGWWLEEPDTQRRIEALLRQESTPEPASSSSTPASTRRRCRTTSLGRALLACATPYPALWPPTRRQGRLAEYVRHVDFVVLDELGYSTLLSSPAAEGQGKSVCGWLPYKAGQLE